MSNVNRFASMRWSLSIRVTVIAADKNQFNQNPQTRAMQLCFQMVDATSNPAMTSPSSSSSSSAAVVSNESSTGFLGLPLLTYDDAWTPEVTQRVSTLVFLMIVTLVGNVAVVVRWATRRRRRSRDRCRRPSRVDVFILNLAVGDLTVCCFTMTTEVLFVVFEEGWVLGPIACKVLLYVQVSVRCRRVRTDAVVILHKAYRIIRLWGFSYIILLDTGDVSTTTVTRRSFSICYNKFVRSWRWRTVAIRFYTNWKQYRC